MFLAVTVKEHGALTDKVVLTDNRRFARPNGTQCPVPFHAERGATLNVAPAPRRPLLQTGRRALRPRSEGQEKILTRVCACPDQEAAVATVRSR